MTALVPDDTWYRCVPPTPTACPPGWYPASPAKRSLPALLAPSRAGQLGVGGVPTLLLRGRTALDVKFGDGALHEPAISSTYQGWPDVLLAFDMWQYWLAPLAVDLAEQWKTVTEDRGGLSPHVERFARYYAAKRGTFLAAFPILRNPMTIYNFDPVEPWDWAHVISAITRPSGPAFNTQAFVPSDLYPQATELAASVVLAFGGSIGRASPERTAPAFDTAAASQALTSLAEIVNASVDPEPYRTENQRDYVLETIHPWKRGSSGGPQHLPGIPIQLLQCLI